MTLPRRLHKLAKENPGAVFCTFLAAGCEQTITFAQLYERGCAYARAYRQMGIQPDDLVLVILQHTPHLFYSFVGAMLAGAVPSFMPFPSPKQRPDLYWADHWKLFGRIAPRLIVTYQHNLEEARAALPGFSIPTLIADDDILRQAQDDKSGAQDDKGGALGDKSGALAGFDTLLGFARSPDDVACLQHSSGTTSLKKGVMLTHRAVLEEVRSYADAIGFGPPDSIASWLPLYHDMGFVACFMTSMLLGTHLVALDPFEWAMRPSLLLDAIQRYRTTFCWLPNFAFSHLVNTAKPSASWDLSSIRAFVNCSEPCKAHTFDRFLERFAPCGVTETSLQVCYAMAENVFGVTQTRLSSVPRVVHAKPDAFAGGEVELAQPGESCVAVLSCGTQIDGVEVRVCAGDGEVLPPGRIGEIRITGRFLFDGYYKLPDKTHERLREGWYRTGDMGFVLDGELFVTGRIDDMLIVNGRNYYAHEIEAIVSAVPSVLPGRNVAIGVEDALTDATVVIVLAECTPGADIAALAQEIRGRVLETLGLAIHSVFPLSPGRLVKTTSGKISRSKNKELYVQGGL